ncbi:MAG: GNAT family N-acetyltransferase [Sulfurisoma sp.]|nr:GNAT family N-acetyltransferase [Sulfurisoma sp.]
MIEPLRGPLLLASDFEVGGFSCGHQALDNYLIRHALQAQRANTARTFVALRGQHVVGYYSLAAASIEPEQAAPRVARGAGRHPIPLTLLARLAVDRREQGRGLGKALMKDAFKRYLAAQEQVASRALLVHAIDEPARNFYLRFSFEPASFDPLHLYILTKDILRALM